MVNYMFTDIGNYNYQNIKCKPNYLVEIFQIIAEIKIIEE